MGDALDEEFLKFQAELFEAEMAATKPEDGREAERQPEAALPPPQRPPPTLAPPPLAPPPRPPSAGGAQQLPPPPGAPPHHGRPPQLAPPPLAPPPGGPPRSGAVVAAAPTIAAPPQPNPVQLEEPAGPASAPPPHLPPPPMGYGMPPPMGGGPMGGMPPPMGGMPPPMGGPPVGGFYGGVPTAPLASKVASAEGKKIGVVRQGAGKKWVDTTLTEWPENDYRIFVGNLGNEVSDAVLTAAFQKFPTFQKAKVVRFSHNGKSKGYGFVSFGDTIEGVKVLREMQGKYVGNRPIQLRKGNADERSVTDKKGRVRTREVTVKEPRAKQPRPDGGHPPAFGGGGFGGRGFGGGGGRGGPRW